MTKPLPPLNAQTKTILLSRTYLDAAIATQPTRIMRHDGITFIGLNAVLRNYPLWNAGSYSELETCLDELRTTDRYAYVQYWLHHVNPYARHYWAPNNQSHSTAHRALTTITSQLLVRTRGNIYVPQEILENAGYTGSQTREAIMPHRRAA